MRRIVLAIQLIGILAMIVALYTCKHEHSERIRLEGNQAALLTMVGHYKTIEGRDAASVQALTLKCGEYERLMAADATLIRSLGLKIKHLESVSHTGSTTNVQISAPICDTVVFRDTVRMGAKAFKWADSWVDIRGVVYSDSVSCSVYSRDTLLQVVHRVPHRFLFFRWGVKELRQEVVSTNPHTTITYSQLIKLQR